MPVMRIGDITTDVEARLVHKRGEEIHLTPEEFALLAEHAERIGQIDAVADSAASTGSAKNNAHRHCLTSLHWTAAVLLPSPVR